jgi:hypothetical protein
MKYENIFALKTAKNGEYDMQQSLMKTMDLSNGLKLDFYDISRKLAGDRWYVGMIIKIDISINDLLITNQQLSNYSVEEIRNALGDSVRFQQKKERHYIDEREKDALLQDLMDSFIKSTLDYLSHPDFSNKYVLKEFEAYLKRQAWGQNDRRG